MTHTPEKIMPEDACPYCLAPHVDMACEECGDRYCDECIHRHADGRFLCPNCDGRFELECV